MLRLLLGKRVRVVRRAFYPMRRLGVPRTPTKVWRSAALQQVFSSGESPGPLFDLKNSETFTLPGYCKTHGEVRRNQSTTCPMLHWLDE
jgi:hypothetical protein